MSEWRDGTQCDNCGFMYPVLIPTVCGNCGEHTYDINARQATRITKLEDRLEALEKLLPLTSDS